MLHMCKQHTQKYSSVILPCPFKVFKTFFSGQVPNDLQSSFQKTLQFPQKLSTQFVKCLPNYRVNRTKGQEFVPLVDLRAQRQALGQILFAFSKTNTFTKVLEGKQQHGLKFFPSTYKSGLFWRKTTSLQPLCQRNFYEWQSNISTVMQFQFASIV